MLAVQCSQLLPSLFLWLQISSFPLTLSFVLHPLSVSFLQHLWQRSAHLFARISPKNIRPDCPYIQTYIHPFNSPMSGTTRVSPYQKGKTNLDFSEARGSEWQWHELGHMLVGTSLQTDNHACIPPLSFLQAGCPSCCPANSVKALKAIKTTYVHI